MHKQFFYTPNTRFNLIRYLIIPVLMTILIVLSGCEQVEQNNIDVTPLEVNLAQTALVDSTHNTAPTSTSAVVGILAKSGSSSSIGTGFAISPHYIASNEHVVGDADTVTLYLKDGTTATGNVVWRDRALDISLIYIGTNMPCLELEDTETLSVGEDVIAVGTPLDIQFQHTVTKGIISALDRTVAVDTDYGESYLQNLIQHDASINPGNSGGPLINSEGKVIGINTLKVASGEGLGFAIPAKSAYNVVNHLVSDGSYITPYIGVYGVDKLVGKYYGKDISQDGVIINNINKNSPAENAGLKLNDIITMIDGKQIKNMLDLRTELYEHKVGDQISITYIRKNTPYTTTITLDRHPQY